MTRNPAIRPANLQTCRAEPRVLVLDGIRKSSTINVAQKLPRVSTQEAPPRTPTRLTEGPSMACWPLSIP